MRTSIPKLRSIKFKDTPKRELFQEVMDDLRAAFNNFEEPGGYAFVVFDKRGPEYSVSINTGTTGIALCDVPELVKRRLQSIV
jgi:hypothetical protein